MPPLLLIPGMMCDARLFGPQIAALSPRFALHLAPISAHETVAALAAAILAAAPARFALAGLSMGGIVAMEILAQAPDRVERLALFDTNPRAETPEVSAAREPQIARVAGGHLAEVMREEFKPKYLAEGPRRAEVLDLVLTMALDLGPEVFIRQSRALQTRPDQQATLRGFPRPTLILCGEADRLCPLERHETMHALIPGSRLEVVPGAGHLPPLETPGAVNAALTRWLEE